MTVESANENESMSEYKNLIGLYTSKIDTESEYASLCTESEHKYYLVEFNEYLEMDSDFAIFDATAETFTYYTKTETTFTQIEK